MKEYHEYCGGVQYHGGYHPLSTMGDIMSTMGCSVPWDTQITKDFSLHSTEHPHGTHDIPHMHHNIPHGTQDNPHGTAHTLSRVIL